MLRWMSLVLIVFALVLTACVQPTPTPYATSGAAPTSGSAPTAGLTDGYPVVTPTSLPEGYPADRPTLTPEPYPAPSSRHSLVEWGAARLAYR